MQPEVEWEAVDVSRLNGVQVNAAGAVAQTAARSGVRMGRIAAGDETDLRGLEHVPSCALVTIGVVHVVNGLNRHAHVLAWRRLVALVDCAVVVNLIVSDIIRRQKDVADDGVAAKLVEDFRAV
jgi:hypothetical protein